jgi:hypothetical protein
MTFSPDGIMKTSSLLIAGLAVVLLVTSPAIAKNRLGGSVKFAPAQLKMVEFRPKAAAQNNVGLRFSDPRKNSEIEKILFDSSYLPPRQIKQRDGSMTSVSDFFLTTSIRYRGQTVSETALCE